LRKQTEFAKSLCRVRRLVRLPACHDAGGYRIIVGPNADAAMFLAVDDFNFDLTMNFSWQHGGKD